MSVVARSIYQKKYVNVKSDEKSLSHVNVCVKKALVYFFSTKRIFQFISYRRKVFLPSTLLFLIVRGGGIFS